MAAQTATAGRDPYQTLGVAADASDDELHSAYRRLVKLHHPDHNGGSADAARRFEEVQEAYAQVRELRRAAPHAQQPPPRASASPDVEARIADLEDEVREAHAARERARQAARDAVAHTSERPSDDELGYVTTDDSFSKIFADARSELTDLASSAREHPIAQRVADLIGELEDLASKPRRKSG
jgi:curved DNA-binding protein CbpA